MPLIAVNGTELYSESHGTGAPLVVLGGLGLDVSEMGVLTGPLAARFRVIAADNRAPAAGEASGSVFDRADGHRRGVPDGPLEVPRAHVLGISLGGRIAMTLALAEAARVSRLVLVATSPRAARARWLVRAGMMLADLPVLRGRHRQPRYAMKAQFDATTRFDATSRLSQITAPVLIVHGTSDHVAPLAMARQMHALIPGSRLVLIDGGHLAPLLTRREQLVAEVSAFLTESA